jgi:hypothetical protein
MTDQSSARGHSFESLLAVIHHWGLKDVEISRQAKRFRKYGTSIAAVTRHSFKIDLAARPKSI